jgi:RNA polymerase sigma-70 factor (ECF subfamily)
LASLEIRFEIVYRQIVDRQSVNIFSLVLGVDYAAGTEDFDLDSTAMSAKLFAPSICENKAWISRSTQNDQDIQRPPDEALLRSVQQGDREALGCLFRRYARAIHGIGHRILRDTAEAEDLVQEVFVYVHRKRSLYDCSKGTARSWIFQIAYTQAFLRRRRLKSLGFYAGGVADALRETELRTESGAAYDQSVEGLFGRNGWKKIVEGLTEDQRETLRLHFFEGYTFTEIAEKLGQSFANIRNHHYRGLEKIRKYLAGNELNG